jgi:hypothetical protein
MPNNVHRGRKKLPFRQFCTIYSAIVFCGIGVRMKNKGVFLGKKGHFNNTRFTLIYKVMRSTPVLKGYQIIHYFARSRYQFNITSWATAGTAA